MPRIMLLGPPGSGKGTQGAIITEAYNIPKISSGDALRESLKNKSQLGLEAKAYIEAGELVPDEFIIEFVEDLLGKSETENGFLLDGYPRTIKQAEALDKWLEKKGSTLDAVFYLNVARDVLLERIATRRACMACGSDIREIEKKPIQNSNCNVCGTALTQRKDDEPETAAKRIDIYNEQTKPLVEYYKEKGLLIEIDGQADIWTQQAQIVKALDAV